MNPFIPSVQLADPISQEMSLRPYVAYKDTPVQKAFEFMKSVGIRHLPVVDEGKAVGVVSERDLRQAVALSDRISLTVKDVMSPDPYCVGQRAPLRAVVREMAERKLGSAVIIDDYGHVMGVFTTTDAMRVLSDLLERSASSRGDGSDISGYLELA